MKLFKPLIYKGAQNRSCTSTYFSSQAHIFPPKIVDTRLRLPTATLATLLDTWLRPANCNTLERKGMQAGTQLELYYELLGRARHQMCVGHATFDRANQARSQKNY